MELKDVLEYWKLILGIVVVVATSTYGILAWAEEQKEIIEAKQQLIHNEQYQESRVDRKRDQIADNFNLIRLLESDDDELTIQEQKFIDSLTEENVRLLQEIEEIEEKLHTE